MKFSIGRCSPYRGGDALSLYNNDIYKTIQKWLGCRNLYN